MKLILAAATAVVLALAFGVTAEEKKDDKKIDAAKLVGKWEITKAAEGGAPKGTLLEFTKDGKLTGSIDMDGTKVDIKGTYKIDGDKLKVDVEVGSDKHENEMTIKSLTADKAVLEDKEGREHELTKKK